MGGAAAPLKPDNVRWGAASAAYQVPSVDQDRKDNLYIFSVVAIVGSMCLSNSDVILYMVSDGLRNFLWVVQIEGAYNKDGRGASIWDVFSHTPGKTHNGDTVILGNPEFLFVFILSRQLW